MISKQLPLLSVILILLFTQLHIFVSATVLQPPNIERTSAKVAETVARLKRIKTEDLDTNVPEAAKPLLISLKRQLLDLIQLTISRDGNSADPEKLEQEITGALGQSGIRIGRVGNAIGNGSTNGADGNYGDIMEIAVRRPQGHNDLLSVTTTIGISCGEDTSLYFFQNRGGNWGLVLAQESNYYNEVSGAQGDFQYVVSNSNATNDFFVVVADVTPWCSSAWMTLRYKVLRPGHTAFNPKVLLNDKHTIYLNDDPVFKLGLAGDTFSLSFTGEDDPKEKSSTKDEDEEVFGPKEFKLSYKVAGNKVTQVHKETSSDTN